MEIERVKNYNQKMLAIVITLLAIGLAIGLLAFAVTVGIEIFSTPKNNSALLSDDRVDELNKNNQRQQVLNFGTPVLVDSTNIVYVVPVGIKVLDQPEESSSKRIATAVGSNNYEEDYSFGYSRSIHHGSFSNLLLYSNTPQTTESIVKSRLAGHSLSANYFKDDIILSFLGAKQDTNSDGHINDDDKQSLYFFSLKDRKLIELEEENATLTSFEFVHNSKDILLTYLHDRNLDNNFDYTSEPSLIKIYRHISGKTEPLVQQNLIEEIQAIVDNKF